MPVQLEEAMKQVQHDGKLEVVTVFACLVQVFLGSVLIAQLEDFVVLVESEAAGEAEEQVHVEVHHVHMDFCLG